MSDDIGGHEVAQAEQELGELIAEHNYITNNGEAVEQLGDIPDPPVENPN